MLFNNGILTEFLIIFMFFIFWNKNKASDQTASTGVRTQTYLQAITYLNLRLFCQLNYTNLSKSELFKNILQVSKWDTDCFLLASQFVCLNVKIGPSLYVKICVLCHFSFGYFHESFFKEF